MREVHAGTQGKGRENATLPLGATHVACQKEQILPQPMPEA